MKAIIAGARKERDYMVEEERSIIRQIIRLTPEAFGGSQSYWKKDELIEFLRKRRLIQVIDENEIENMIFNQA